MEKIFFKKHFIAIFFALLSSWQTAHTSLLAEKDIIQFFTTAWEITPGSSLKQQNLINSLNDAIERLSPKELSSPFSLPVSTFPAGGSASFLHVACSITNDDIAYLIVDKLLNKGGAMHINMKDFKNHTPFIIAYLTGNIKTAHLLVEKGGSVDENSDVLSLAVANDDREVVQKMLKINPVDKTNINEKKTYEILHSAIQEFKEKQRSYAAITALFVTTFYRYPQRCIEALLVNTSLFDEIIDANLPELIPLFLNFSERLLLKNNHPLVHAIEKGYFGYFITFLENQKQQENDYFGKKIDNKGNTILHLLIKNFSKYSSGDEITRTIFNKAPLYLKNKANETPVSLVYKSDNPDLIIYFIKAGVCLGKSRFASINDEVVTNRASRFGDLDKGFSYFDVEPYDNIISTKKKIRSDYNPTFQSPLDKKLTTLKGEEKQAYYELPCCLNFATINAETEKDPQFPFSKNMLKKIVEKDHSILTCNTIPYDTETSYLKGSILHEACYWGWIDIVKVLASCGGNLSSPDSWGNTPLHIAVKTKNKKLIKYLLEQKVKFTSNKSSKMPLFFVLKDFIATHDEEDFMIIKTLLNRFSEKNREFLLAKTLEVMRKEKSTNYHRKASIKLNPAPIGYEKLRYSTHLKNLVDAQLSLTKKSGAV